MTDTLSAPDRKAARARRLARADPGFTPPYILARRPRKLLVVSNCQTFGLVNCLRNLSDFAVDGMLINAFLARPDQTPQKIGDYDHMLTIKAATDSVTQPDLRAKMTSIPHIYFNAFHPDMFRLDPLLPNQKKISGPAGHSIIAAACFERGLSVADTRAMFRGDIFEALGYFDMWDQAKSGLFTHFHELGFEVEQYFYRWCRTGCFMHANNHPAIGCLVDIAAQALAAIGVPASPSYDKVADNLMSGPIFPVYDQIGAFYGVPGSYRFKPALTAYTIGLEEFIGMSFAAYRESGEPRLRLSDYDRVKVDRVATLLD